MTIPRVFKALRTASPRRPAGKEKLLSLSVSNADGRAQSVVDCSCASSCLVCVIFFGNITLPQFVFAFLNNEIVDVLHELLYWMLKAAASKSTCS